MDCSHLKEVLQDAVNAEIDNKEYPNELDVIIEDTAKSGIVRFTWDLLKPLLRSRLQKVLDSGFEGQEFKDDEASMCSYLLEQLDKFDNPPFTIQRVCELISDPTKHYKKIGAYMRAMERNLLVVTTQEPDLTWMKSPRLTQLLEEPVAETPAPSHMESNATENHTMNHGLSTQELDRHTVSLAPNVVSEKVESEMNGQELFDSVARLPRKRKSCERDDPEPSPNEEMGTVLQEADSTTTVETDQQETAMDIDTVAVVPTLNSDARSEVDTEQNMPKRLKPSSPETTTPPKASPMSDEPAEGEVTSALERNGQVQNERTGQSECLDIGK